VAWRLLWLTYISRTNPSAEATKVLEPLQWQALYCFIHSVNSPPRTPPTVNQCIRWIAQLGGFLGRKGDGEPGVKTIWRGLRRLENIAQTWKIFYPSSSPPVNDDYVKKYVSKA
jgi:Transposase Tn5 dimerisation domain